MRLWIWLVLISSLFLSSGIARADEIIEEHSQTACDTGTQTFKIQPYPPTSNNDLSTDAVFVVVDKTQIVHCRLGAGIVQAKIEIFPGRGFGHCGTLGFARLLSLSVRGMELLKAGVDIPSDTLQECLDFGLHEEFDSIKLHLGQSSAELYTCTHPAKIDEKLKVTCRKQSFDIAALAAAHTPTRP